MTRPAAPATSGTRACRLMLCTVAAIATVAAGARARAELVVTPLAYSGASAPGLPAGLRYKSILQVPSINRAGRYVFVADVEPPAAAPRDWVIYAGQAGAATAPAPLVRAGDAAPGISGGGTFDGYGVQRNPLIDDAGNISFDGWVQQTPQPLYPAGIWQHRPASGLTLLHQWGESAPDLPSSVHFNNEFNSLSVAGNGHVAFTSSTNGPAPHAPQIGIWVRSGGATRLLYLTGTPAPGGDGATIFGTFPFLETSGDGRVLFLGDLQNASNDPGVWAGAPGALALVARRGMPAPGLPGHTFSGFSSSKMMQPSA